MDREDLTGMRVIAGCRPPRRSSLGSGPSRAKEMTGKVLREFLALATVMDKAKKRGERFPFRAGVDLSAILAVGEASDEETADSDASQRSPRKTGIKKKKGWTILSLWPLWLIQTPLPRTRC